MIVRLKEYDSDHPALTMGREYAVLGIEADHYRVLDDHGEPVLYPPELFEMVDSSEPTDWIATVGDSGERYAYPPALAAVGFFEDYFDRDPQAVAAFWQVVNQRMEHAVAG